MPRRIAGRSWILLCLLIPGIGAGAGGAVETGPTLEMTFRNPPDSARPWVYWFWMNGNITREGITADLEAMRDVGIGGCLIMHVKLGSMSNIADIEFGDMPPDGPVTFMSDEFRGLFQHAVQEADRLGLKIDMNNADGFTGSGGPWVPVEKSMKKLVWTETSVSGNRDVSLRLGQPEAILRFYRDVAVIAFPRQTSLHQQTIAAQPTLSAPDSEFEAGALMDEDRHTRTPLWREGLGDEPQLLVSFPEPYTADTLVIQNVDRGRGRPVATLETSVDGTTYQPVGTLSLKWYPAAPTNTIRFDARTARHFRLTFASDSQNVSLGEVALGRSNKIHYWEPKAGFTRFGEWGGGSELYSDRKTTAGESAAAKRSPASTHAVPAIRGDDVLDLSDKMDSEGRLAWNVPAGEWTVLRIGYTSTGIKNHPASEGGHGLECDKLHPSGVEAAFGGMLQKLISDSGERVGRTFTHAHIDSWEVGIQNWTEGMAEAFEERNGYDLTPFYPLLVSGHAVDSNDASERFLWDLRRTLLTMMADNYLGRMSRLSHEAGLEFSSEAAGRQTFLHNPVDLLARSDLPMGEFWPHEGSPRVDGKAAASVAHLYDKPLVGAEAFTGAREFASWQSHPFELKGIGDEAFCLGINHFVIHYSVHQAYPGFRPGFAMGPWGIHLDRMNTWWNQSKPWFEYLARSQHLLRQGQFVADVLYFPGEGAPHHLGKREDLSVPLPPGYDFDGADRETLLTRLAVRDGRLVLPHGQSYRYLMLPGDRTMTCPMARRIRQLVDEGATVIGPRPETSPSLRGFPECDQEIRDLGRDLWDSGRVRWGQSFEEIASADGLSPDFQFQSVSPEADVRYIHRRQDDADLYFVANRTKQASEIVATFRQTGRQPELWHPETGRIRDLPDWQLTADGRTAIPLRLEPVESVFVAFRRPASPSASDRPNFLGFETVAAISGPWTLEFPAGTEASDSIQLSELASWTEHEAFGVRHFSGTATYRTTFSTDRTGEPGDPERYLDLGDVHVIAEVTLNGRNLGILWKPPYRVPITKALQPGGNDLEIRVTNLWPNRLIGDEQFPDDARWNDKYLQAWPQWFLQGRPRPEPDRKTFAVVKHYDKGSPLLTSGLLGPVTLKTPKARPGEVASP